MDYLARKTIVPFLFLFCALFTALVLSTTVQATMVPLDDDTLSQVDGQALIEMQKTTMNGFTFYTVGMDATMSLNLNIARLQLGCNGINGAGACDLDLSNVSFGCGSADGTNCFTPATSCQTGICTATSGSVTSLLPFVMNNPFLQLAIQNDGSPTLRSLAGIRLGAASVSGPLSVGNFNSFSGYFSGTAGITMGAQNDMAVTCDTAHAPCTGTAQGASPGVWINNPSSNGVNQFGYAQPAKALGLADDYACVNFGANFCLPYDSVTINYNGVSLSNLPVVVSGTRTTSGLISNAVLGTDVHNIVNSASIQQTQNSCGGFCSGFVTAVANAALGQIKPSMENNIDNQLANALGLTQYPQSQQSTLTAELNAYNIPYNLTNVHQISVNANGFGLSFENQPIQYPGYAQAVNTGWAMYATNAFALTVSQPLSLFVNNIVSGAAKAGNIVGLPGPYQNCYGSATFC